MQKLFSESSVLIGKDAGHGTTGQEGVNIVQLLNSYVSVRVTKM